MLFRSLASSSTLGLSHRAVAELDAKWGGHVAQVLSGEIRWADLDPTRIEGLLEIIGP